MNKLKIKSFNNFKLNENNIMFDDIYNVYQSNKNTAEKLICDLMRSFPLTEFENLIKSSDDYDFKYWLKMSMIKCISQLFIGHLDAPKATKRGNFTDTMLSNSREYILRVYDQDGEVAHSIPLDAKNKEEAEIIALDTLNTLPEYDEEAGWDYMVT